ncbi:MAG: universal stress protein, partial [Acidimicrobiia bacterium]|nr:universal stress protein [Acidimicrobiia bacterium]
MDTPQRILVPLDLSERSEAAAEYAAGLARALGARLVLVVNVNDPERRMLEPFAHDEQITIEQAGEAALRRVARRLADDLEVSVMVRQADAAVVGLLEASRHA